MYHSKKYISKISILFLSLLIFIAISPASDASSEYLSTEKVAGIGIGSGAAAGMGYMFMKTRTKSGLSNWTKPLPGEKKLMNFLGGKYYPGKTNFLDNGFGSVITPLAALPLIIGIDSKWPRENKSKDITQDLFLLSSGFFATSGVTSFFKGIFKRERPYVAYQPEGYSKKAFDIQSFNSGHSSTAFFTVTYLNLRLRSAMRENLSASEYHRYRVISPIVLYSWATFVGWTRIHSYKHYPSDVIVGAAVGYLMAELFYSLGKNQSDSNLPQSGTKMIFQLHISF